VASVPIAAIMQAAFMVGMATPTKVQPMHDVSLAHGSPPPVGGVLELSGTVVGVVRESSGAPESSGEGGALQVAAQLLHPSKPGAQAAQLVVHA
jgi:hypothetical protein